MPTSKPVGSDNSGHYVATRAARFYRTSNARCPMAVHDLERARVEALARELARTFRKSSRGWLLADTAELEDVERWRRAARRAGRLLGIHIRTGITHDGLRVWMA